MKNILAALIFLLPAATLAAEYGKVQYDKSNIIFSSRQMGVPVDGLFKKFSAAVRFDTAKPESGTAQIVIDIASIDAGGAEANDEVRGKSWFDAVEFPSASFISSSIKPLGGGKFEAIGKMTIKGRTLEVRAPFRLKEDKGLLDISGAFVMNRLDFGIGSGMWGDTSVVADEVQIRFHFVVK